MDACVFTHGLEKAARRTLSPVPVHPLARRAAKRLRVRLVHVLHNFFICGAPKIIGQVITLRGRQHFVKAAATPEERAAVADILKQIDLSGWVVLAGEIDDIIAEIAKDGGIAGFAQLGIDTTANREFLNIVNDEALSYGAQRSAEMVGMRRLADGRLIPNPDAKWQITESTRDMLRVDVTQALTEGWSNDILAAKLAQNYGFSDARAMVIARTETIRASNAGALASYQAAGTEEKQWTTAEDDKVSEDCAHNGDQGPIPIYDAFDSGDQAPPAHPNCRCVIVPVEHFLSQGRNAEQTPKAESKPQETTAQALDVTAQAIVSDVTTAIEAQAAQSIKWIGDVSKSFQSLVESTINKMPPGVLRKLKEFGAEFKAGRRVTEIEPTLKGVHPRGWPPGSTWDSTDGFAMGKVVAVAEQYRPIGSRAFINANRADGVLAHETGHAFDRAMAHESMSMKFLKAYKADAAPLRAAIKRGESGARRLSYYLQSGNAGPSEAFAEVFAQVATQTMGSYMADITASFPRVTEYIRGIIQDLEGAA